MKRKAGGRVHHQRECFYCKGGIAEQQPVFLVGMPSGSIVGPFHAGCAEKVKLRARDALENGELGAEEFGRFLLKPREETLPW